MATKTTTLDNLADAIYEDLLEWDSKVEGELASGIKAIAQEAKLMIQDNARARFKGTGAYAKSWRVSKARRTGPHEAVYIVHAQAPYYRLTHLLEKDHKVRNRKNGPVLGEYQGREHIAPAEARAEQLTMELVNKVFRV